MKEKGKSDYSIMQEPPEVKHAMEVAKNQSIVSVSSVYLKSSTHVSAISVSLPKGWDCFSGVLPNLHFFSSVILQELAWI